MVRFLFRVASFILFVAVLALGARAVNHWLLRFQGPVWTDRPHTLILGDSHVRVAIDPSAVPGSRNVAQDAEPLMVTHLKLERLLEAASEVSTVVLGFGPHSLAPFHDGKLQSPDVAPEMARRYYSLGPWWKVPGIPISGGAVLTAEARYLWTPNLDLTRNFVLRVVGRPVPDPPFVGWHAPLGASSLTDGVLQAVATRHFGVDAASTLPSRVQEASLRRAVAMARDRGLLIVLVSTPTHPRYRALVPRSLRERFEDVWSELTLQSGVYGLDLSDWTLPDAEYADFDHVSAVGAARVSAEVASRLEDWTR